MAERGSRTSRCYRFKLNVPTLHLDTIGAGAGMILKVDPLTRKISLGPESAGSDPTPDAPAVTADRYRRLFHRHVQAYKFFHGCSPFDAWARHQS